MDLTAVWPTRFQNVAFLLSCIHIPVQYLRFVCDFQPRFWEGDTISAEKQKQSLFVFVKKGGNITFESSSQKRKKREPCVLPSVTRDGAIFPLLFSQIAQLFVSPIGGDGRPVFESYTGAYAVKITIDGKWQVVIVDDYFPALEASKTDDDNKGLAVGHSYGAHELWVSLLEKVRL